MASSTTLDPSVLSLLQRSYATDQVSATDDAARLSSSLFASAQYTDAEKAEINQWVITAAHIGQQNEDAAKTAERLSSLNTHLSTRTTLLGTKPSVADIALFVRLKPLVENWTPDERTGERGHHHIVRHVDFVQNAPIFGLKLEEKDRLKIDPNDVSFTIKPFDAKAEKERKKKEKEAAAAVGAATAAAAGGTQTSIAATQPAEAAQAGGTTKKERAKDKARDLGETVAAAVGAETPGVAQPSGGKEKKEKAPKQPKSQKAPPKEDKPLSPALIDLRVGHILKAINHPNADSLYVSTIACGDAPGTDNTSEHDGQVVRTVCSGLNGLVPLEEMQGRRVVVVCNLKPVTMRGIKSCAMVLAASPKAAPGDDDGHKGPVELVNPPEGAQAGERVYFEGWEGEAEPVLNPKKKVWETVQPGFTTTEELEVGFKVEDVPQLAGEGVPKRPALGKLRTKGAVCTVKTLKGATVR